MFHLSKMRLGRSGRVFSGPSALGKRLSVGGLLLAGLSMIVLPAPKAEALEDVRLAYSGYEFGSLSVSDLVSFSETGQLSQNLEALLGVIKVDQATALGLLTTEIAVDGGLLEQASRTFIGESFFQLVGTTVSLPDSSEPSWTYLRDALVASASDSRVSTLEVLQEFGANSVVIDTDKLGPMVEQIRSDTSTIEAFFETGFLNQSAE